MKHRCAMCTKWYDDAVIGEATAKHLLFEHEKTHATFPSESKLFVLPTARAERLRNGPCVMCQQPAHCGRATPAPNLLGITNAMHDCRCLSCAAAICRTCRTCHRLPCACPQDVIASEQLGPRAPLKVTFEAASPARLIENVRAWLAEMDGPVQGDGREGSA